MRRLIGWGVAAVVSSCFHDDQHSTAYAQAVQQGTTAVELKLVATVGANASTPNFGAHSGDPRFLYVGQKTGEIRILDFNQPNPLLGTVFLDVDEVLAPFRAPSFAFEEFGLLGGAFHPNFSTAGAPGYRKFYTYTSEDRVTTGSYFTHPEIGSGGHHQSVIREWTAGDPDGNGVMTIDTNIASRVLMRMNQPQSNHNGGAIAFGPDDYLYIAMGDGGSGNDREPNNGSGTNNDFDGHTNQNNPDGAGGVGFLGHGNAQDRRNVYGKILRIKPTIRDDDEGAPPTSLSSNGEYRIPADNPFTAASNPVDDRIPGWQESWVDEIYAFGLRNPFRMGFDRETGKLYVGDVGQSAREEVNLIENGGNYGWVAREGSEQNPAFPSYVAAAGAPFLNPIGEYPNGTSGTGGQAVIGGFVYRGSRNPQLEGKYIFGDHNRQSTGPNSGGRMMYMDVTESVLNQVFDLAITGSLAKPTTMLHGISEDANGELYFFFQNGQILTLLPQIIPGDYNRDGYVDAADYTVWRNHLGDVYDPADGDGSGTVDDGDYFVWRSNYGRSVLDAPGGGGLAGAPEPTIIAMSLPLVVYAIAWRRRREAARTAMAKSELTSGGSGTVANPPIA